MLTYKGILDAKKIGEYDGKETCKLQFVERDENGAISLTEIKVPEQINHKAFKEGETVEFPVTYSVFNDKVYFRVTDVVASK